MAMIGGGANSHGTVMVDGTDIWACRTTHWRLQRQIGFVFQFASLPRRSG
jgi:ABC-type transporter Mla maintaining outer membrane lipid asymmetry ATPase subunit MlaF